ncbi:MAG: phosphotransferase [Halioglobus sp.]|nr:phosphotransferase [Halioglobus sp.]
MSISTPLQVIACDPPRFGHAEAREILRVHYGLEGEITQLVSERDQNFLLKENGGGRWVLKISNADEDPAVTDFQIRALQHIAAKAADVVVPIVRNTLTGTDRVLVSRGNDEHTIRLVSYLRGRPLENEPLTAALARDTGRTLACLGQALSDFSHAGAAQTLLWDMKHALALRELLPKVGDAALRDLLAGCLDDFEKRALPEFASLRSQVIHNDLNPANILIDPDHPERVAGVIDFGDMQFSPLVVDLAVAAAYWRNDRGDPLELIAELLAAYHAVVALTMAEIDLLYDLVCTRLATTVAILAWREGEAREGDAYLDAAAVAEGSAAPFLRRLRELPREVVSRRLRLVCASVTESGDRAQPVL